MQIKIDKKGSVRDMFLMGALIFIFAVTSIIGYRVMTDVSDNFNSSGVLDANSTQNVIDVKNRFAGVFDGLMLFIVIGLTISTLILAFMIRTHPVFFMISLFILVLLTIVSSIMSDAYEQMRTSTDLTVAASEFTMTNTIMTQFPIFIIVLSILIAIITFSKGGGGSEL